jgi:hypothetical protein
MRKYGEQTSIVHRFIEIVIGRSHKSLPKVTGLQGLHRGCLECRLTRHGAPHFFRHRCGGRFERHKLGTLWRVRRHSKQPHRFGYLVV